MRSCCTSIAEHSRKMARFRRNRIAPIAFAVFGYFTLPSCVSLTDFVITVMKSSPRGYRIKNTYKIRNDTGLNKVGESGIAAVPPYAHTPSISILQRLRASRSVELDALSSISDATKKRRNEQTEMTRVSEPISLQHCHKLCFILCW